MRGQPQASPARSGAAGGPRRDAMPPGPGDARRQHVARPLPDPVAIRLCRVPDPAPPYDDEAPGGPGPGRADVLAAAIVAALGGGDRAGPAARARPPEGPRADGGPRPAKPARPPAAAGHAGTARPADAGMRRTASPGPQGWPSRFAQVLAETLAGSRPPAQIAPWTTERARSRIRRLGPLLAAGQRPLVQRIITSAPSAGVVEMSVVVGFGPRVRALAVRLERTEPRAAAPGQAARQPRWICTAVEAA